MKKLTILLSAFISCILISGTAYAEKISEAPIYFNDTLMEFKNPPMLENGCTIVPVRELSEKAGFEILWDGTEKSIDAYNEKIQVTMYIGNKNIRVLSCEYGSKDIESILAPEIINSVTYIPLRVVSEAFGADVTWDSKTNSIYIYMKDFSSEELGENISDPSEETDIAKTGHTFYSQYDPTYLELYKEAPYNWTASRNGYCYVTSYAMLLTDITNTTVTPKDIADINIAAGGNPSICYHGDITGTYGTRLIPALDSSSVYYKSYDSTRGLTYIDNLSDENVIAAIKEALDRHPLGVMVRETSMPHTMVAVGYSGDTIYFNDPALKKGNVTWEDTCLKKRSISSIVAICAIE